VAGDEEQKRRASEGGPYKGPPPRPGRGKRKWRRKNGPFQKADPCKKGAACCAPTRRNLLRLAGDEEF
jgi:hypothetical protein